MRFYMVSNVLIKYLLITKEKKKRFLSGRLVDTTLIKQPNTVERYHGPLETTQRQEPASLL